MREFKLLIFFAIFLLSCTQQKELNEEADQMDNKIICEKDIILKNQNDVDTFVENNNCSRLASLEIGDKTDINYSIINLSGLSKITYVDKLLIRNNASLKTLNGLQNLIEIETELEISSNSSLESLDDLNIKEFIRLDFTLIDNNMLTSIDGFELFPGCGNSIIIAGHDKLTSINGFNKLSGLPGGIAITSNPLLVDITGFSNLRGITDGTNSSNVSGGAVSRGFTIVNNPQLINFCGFLKLFDRDNIDDNNSGFGLAYGPYFVEDNKYNPTRQNLRNGNCSE